MARVYEKAPCTEALPDLWRARAEGMRPYAPAAATAFDHCAAELEAALSSASADLLTLQEAAEASGYSADHLGRLIRTGRLPSYGRPHSPRLRRSDLPRKAGRVDNIAPTRQLHGASPRQVVAAVIHAQQRGHR